MGFWKSIKQALGPKRYTIGSISMLLGGLYAPLQTWLKGVGVTFLPEVHFVSSALIAFLFCLALFFAFRLRDLETRLSPNLAVSEPVINEADWGGGVRVRQDSPQIQSMFVHIVVKNDSEEEIPKCSVRLLALTKRDEGGHVVEAPIKHPIQLITASTHLAAETIYPIVPQHYDLMYTRSDTNRIDIAPGIAIPNRLRMSFFDEDYVDFDFTIAVTGDKTPTVTQSIRVCWRGKWDTVIAKRLQHGNRQVPKP